MAPARPIAETEQLVIHEAIRSGINMRHRRRGWIARAADASLEKLPLALRAHHWCHGGEEGGLGFFANASADLAPWDDTEFVINGRRRLRLKLAAQGEPCMHLRRAARKSMQMQHSQQSGDSRQSPSTDGACATALDEYADHAVQCMIGGDHTAAHDAFADELAGMHQAAGLRVRREVLVPQLATPSKTEPRADLMAWGTVALPVTRLDVTIVSPWASRNQEATRTAPAESARRAEESKRKEYGARGGISIIGLGIEAGGRHGPQLCDHLKLLASLARQRDSFSGREPRCHLKLWRTRIAILIGRFTAHTVCTALGGQLPMGSVAHGRAKAVQIGVGPARNGAPTASAQAIPMPPCCAALR